MAFSATSSSGPSSEINVTPLIDVLLVLLIIFMVIVPTAQRGLDSSQAQGRGTAAGHRAPSGQRPRPAGAVPHRAAARPR